MKKLIYILSILLIISLSLNIYYYNKGRSSGYNLGKEYVTVQKRDTIVEYKYRTDTIYNTKTNTEYKYITINDTIYIENKPEIYKDSTENYNITINAVKLNSYQLNIHLKDSIQYDTKIIRETVYKKHSPFSISLFAGPSYDFINNKFGVSVGVGVSFRLK